MESLGGEVREGGGAWFHWESLPPAGEVGDDNRNAC